MKNIIFIIIQCTWGIIQTIYGFIMFITNYKNSKHIFFKGEIVTFWEKSAGFSMGLFIFVPPKPRFYNKKYNYSKEELKERLMIHEYGHSIQSLILGPLYLIIIGIPATIWSFSKKYNEIKKNKKISYFEFYTEKWANYLGEKVTNKKSMEQIDI